MVGSGQYHREHRRKCGLDGDGYHHRSIASDEKRRTMEHCLPIYVHLRSCCVYSGRNGLVV